MGVISNNNDNNNINNNDDNNNNNNNNNNFTIKINTKIQLLQINKNIKSSYLRMDQY